MPAARRPSPFRCLLAAVAIAVAVPARSQALHGAGATFPAPVYAAWAEAWSQDGHGTLRYDRIGSGNGIALVEHGQADFGATDAPLTPDQLARAGLLQLPAVIGGVVPVVNLSGIARGQLRLDAATLSAIYRGRITSWRDPAIAALNPSLQLPDAHITVVHRADASGTTWLWSRWLSADDAAWRDEVGVGATLAWPTGDEGLGNEGVASLVQRTRAAIGYVAFAYARRHGLSDVALPSHDGPVVRASRASFEAAVAAARWRTPADLSQSLIDQPGAGSWPIVGASFLLVPRAVSTAATPAPALAFLDWALTRGAPITTSLDYVPLPDAAVRLVREAAAMSTPTPAR